MNEEWVKKWTIILEMEERSTRQFLKFENNFMQILAHQRKSHARVYLALIIFNADITIKIDVNTVTMTPNVFKTVLAKHYCIKIFSFHLFIYQVQKAAE